MNENGVYYNDKNVLPVGNKYFINNILGEICDEISVREVDRVFITDFPVFSKKGNYMYNFSYNLPLIATGVKLANPELSLFIIQDGSNITGLLHSIIYNSNINIFLITEFTQVYSSPLNLAVSYDASFIARCYINDFDEVKNICKRAVVHSGTSIVEIILHDKSREFFDKINSLFYYVDERKNPPVNRETAFKFVSPCGKIPLGVFYINTSKDVLEEKYNKPGSLLWRRHVEIDAVYKFLAGEKS